MNFLWDKVTEWLKELLIDSIMSNLTGLFDNVNRQVAGIADNVGATPQAWNGGVFGMIRNLSDNVILPIAGVILALVATFLMIFAMMPFFALGLYEKNGEPLEAVLRHIIESRYLRPRRRIYQTQNIYALLEKQAQLENEVKAIAQGNKQKAHRKRKAAD